MKNGVYIEKFGTFNDCKVHYKDDIIFHVEYSYGNKYWFNENGKYHRLDGPAIETYYNSKKWYKEWYLDGRYIPVSNQEEFERYLNTLAFR